MNPQFRTFFLFATAFSAGIAAVLLFLPVEKIGRKFFILMSIIAISFSMLAFGASGLSMGYFHLALAGLLIVYNVLLPPQSGLDSSARREASTGRHTKSLRGASTLALLAGAGCGIIGLAKDAVQYPVPLEIGGAQGPWLAASFLSSSWVLGSAITAMVLGHWYLVLRNLSFKPLARVTWILLGALVFRIAAAGGAAFAQGERWSEMVSSSGPAAFFLGPGVFLLARALFGFAAPLTLGWMTWKCVELRSNQSATGILYVILAFVLIGEMIAKYFLLSERLVI